jgi:hypothetical protein
MGAGLKRTLTVGSSPVFQGTAKDRQIAQGGFSLYTTGLILDAPGAESVIPAGSPMSFDESTRVAMLLKTARVYENATNTATAIKVYKGHQFKAGEYAAAVVGGKAYAITIDTSNALYDVITVGTTLAVALTADTSYLFQSSATGASAAALNVSPNGLLWSDAKVAVGESLSVVIRGTVYARRIPYFADLVTALSTNGAKIIFSQSY